MVGPGTGDRNARPLSISATGACDAAPRPGRARRDRRLAPPSRFVPLTRRSNSDNPTECNPHRCLHRRHVRVTFGATRQIQALTPRCPRAPHSRECRWCSTQPRSVHRLVRSWREIRPPRGPDLRTVHCETSAIHWLSLSAEPRPIRRRRISPTMTSANLLAAAW